jgi:hypothetical protein
MSPFRANLRIADQLDRIACYWLLAVASASQFRQVRIPLKVNVDSSGSRTEFLVKMKSRRREATLS